jgi:hypothetical protein
MKQIVKFILLIFVALTLFQQARSQEKGLNYEQLTQILQKILSNKSVSTPSFKTEIKNINFSQCSMNFSILSSIPDKGSMELSYKSNLKFLKETRYGKNPNLNNSGLVRLYFGNKIVETKIFEDGNADAALTDIINIAVENEEVALTISNLFDKLGATCKKDDKLYTTNEPSLKETTNWLTDKIEKTEVINKFQGEMIRQKYESIRFSQCEMRLITTTQILNLKTIDKYAIDFASLSEVAVGEKNGEAGVTLTFDQNFNIDSESISGNSVEKESSRRNTINVHSSRYEDARRIGFAFTRLLELCSKETKEPF